MIRCVRCVYRRLGLRVKVVLPFEIELCVNQVVLVVAKIVVIIEILVHF